MSVLSVAVGKRWRRSCEDARLEVAALEHPPGDEQRQQGQREHREQHVVGDHARQAGDVVLVGLPEEVLGRAATPTGASCRPAGHSSAPGEAAQHFADDPVGHPKTGARGPCRSLERAADRIAVRRGRRGRLGPRRGLGPWSRLGPLRRRGRRAAGLALALALAPAVSRLPLRVPGRDRGRFPSSPGRRGSSRPSLVAVAPENRQTRPISGVMKRPRRVEALLVDWLVGAAARFATCLTSEKIALS